MVDGTPPELSLNGAATIQLECGDTWTDPGATAIDTAAGDISGDIVVGGDTVDPNTPGDYTITYDVSDPAGMSSPQVTRTVQGGGGGGGYATPKGP